MPIYYFIVAAKIIIFISIINVWFIRFNKPTPWRGGNSKSMKEEFETYGLSQIIMYIVGTMKVGLAVLLIISLWINDLSTPAAGAMGIFMLGAIAMHFKADDPNIKSFPALILFLLSIGIVVAEVILDGI
ncbi:DoxX family protein [Arenibacter troitsensis]|uniref:DoxX-like family protein n=1 Tax=Arenibacter troitsensis TaxID=188872 RepID=A0A1X7J8M3_9FLAO|nr:DoxX family protein [Arenibacter troitsensis]SMG23843.1 DoxX-like family protein [Arenibacter troitsensis]